MPTTRTPKERKKNSIWTHWKQLNCINCRNHQFSQKIIKPKLLLDNVCVPETLPSKSYLNKGLSELGYSHKKIKSVPGESETPAYQAKYDAYLDLISDIDANTMHFFDECSVTKSSGKRMYGSSVKGSRAVEVQRYASNATYTVNLLDSASGLDYFNILGGASNGQELLQFLWIL